MIQRLHNGKVFAAMFAAACAACSGQSAASTIIAPVTARASSQFISPTGKDFSIGNTIDQSGLSLGYESGVTDLDTYLANKPEHTSVADGNEWFSRDLSQNLWPRNTRGNLLRSQTPKRSAGKTSKKDKDTSAISGKPLVKITYGFSALTSINGFILWNEEYAGIGTTQLWSSIDGKKYSLLSTITPTPSTFAPNGSVIPYLAQVFSFDPTIMLFFRLLIYDCPKPSANHDSYRGCGIGEVAFSSVPSEPNETPPVPVPAALPLLGSALGILAWFGRRQRNRN